MHLASSLKGLGPWLWQGVGPHSSPGPSSLSHRYLEHRGTGKASQKRMAFNDKFDLVENACKLFGFTQQVKCYHRNHYTA